MNIGRIRTPLSDRTRLEYYNDGDSSRKLMISIFYPTDRSSEKNAVYTDLFEPSVDETLKILKDLGADTDAMEKRSINIYNGAPGVCNIDELPLVVLSPAYGTPGDMYLYTILKLVREGSVVITIDHPYDSAFTIFPDGSIIKQSEAAGKVNLNRMEDWRSIVEVRTEDIIFILDCLPELRVQMNESVVRLNTENIMLVGHSAGGIAAYKAAVQDNRLKGLILLDAGMHLMPAEKLQVPVLSVRQEASTLDALVKQSGKEDLSADYIKGQLRLWECSIADKFFLKVKSTSHMTFCDIPLFTGDPEQRKTTAISHENINEIVIPFVKDYLFGKTGSFVDYLDHASENVIRIDKYGEDFYCTGAGKSN